MNTQIRIVRGLTGGALAFALAASAVPAAAQGQLATQQPAETAPALSPLGQAVKQALAAKLGQGSTANDFYRGRGFEPFWIAADGAATDAAVTLIAHLARAGEHALPVGRYDPDGLRAMLTGAGAAPDRIAAAEAALSAAYLRYARDVRSGLLEPRQVDRDLNVHPERPDEGALLTAAAAAVGVNMSDHIAGLAPQSGDYVRLMQQYATFRSAARSDLWGAEVPKGRTMRPGERHARVKALRDRLTAMGDFVPTTADRQAATETLVATAETANDTTPEAAADPAFYDEALAEAVRKFQIRHGLNPDGAVGPATLDAINTGPEERIRQIAVNLERLRWLNRDLGERHVLVNLAGFTMDVMRGETSEFHSRVVVGKAGRYRTPEFSDQMSHMVINPSWHVPRSIASEEILPELQADPTYLSRNGMRLVGSEASEEEIDWSTVTPGTFPGRITQRPGSGNALGRVKFMFPNRFAIYLHDTPSRRLFERDVRAYSHGCVRVAKPLEFAYYLLTGQEDDPAGAFHAWLDRGRERRVDLVNPLPVHLTYRTAWVDPQGVENFRGDIYGRDRKVADALLREGVAIVQ